MRCLTRPETAALFEGKRVALVGGGPSAALNPPDRIDSYDLIVRINNYRIAYGTGRRTDVLYSFFGNSIHKSVDQLKRDGVKLCMCKCPDAAALDSDWHFKHNKPHGVDFRYIYRKRHDWWFCDRYVPSVEAFMEKFKILGGHIPTTGFAAILDIVSFKPQELYLTGFDFFRSRRHNLNEPWREKNDGDPIGHVPEQECEWVAKNATLHPIVMDGALAQLLPVRTVAA